MRRNGFSGYLQRGWARLSTEVGATNLFLLFLLVAILFYPLLSVGITTNDDARMAINMGRNASMFQMAREFAVGQGRFSFFWGYPLLRGPYVIDSQFWYLAMKYGSILVLLSALYYAASRSFRSSWIALVSLLFFLAFIQNGWEHNALVSYPLVFNIYAALFLVSLGLFSTAIDRNNLALASLSGILYFFSIGTELFVLFFPLYVAVLLSRAAPDEPITRRLVAGKRYILAVALPLIIYLAIYLVWRGIYPSSYDGNNLNAFNFLTAGKVVATYSLYAFPLASLNLLIAPDFQLNISHFIKPAVAGFLFARLMTTKSFIVPQARSIIIGAVLTGVGIFVPNLLLGFVQKHQIWVAAGTHTYLYTYYSFISAVVFAALVLAYMNVKSRAWHPILRQAFITMGVLAIMTLSFAVEVRNQNIAFDQKQSHRKWQLMDEVIKSPTFMEIPDGSIVVAPTLFAHYRGIAFVTPDYWSQYVKYKTGKNVLMVGDKCRIGVSCYVLVFRQATLSDDQFMVLAKIMDTDLQVPPGLMVSSDLVIYSMPIRARAVLMGSFVPSEVPPKLLINGIPVVNVAGTGLFSFGLPNASGHGVVQSARLAGNIKIYPDKITISPYSIELRLRSFTAELADGIYFNMPEYSDFLVEVSGMGGYELWGRWTDATAGPVAKFRFKQTLPRKFTLEITGNAYAPNAGLPVKVRVGAVEKTFVIPPNKEIDTYRLAFETDGTADTLEITPPKPTRPKDITPENNDPRLLGLGLVSIKIK